MSTIEIEKVIREKPESRTEPKSPKPYQVVVESRAPIGCVKCLLSGVFNMSGTVLAKHFLTIAIEGSDIVMVTSKDIAESKVEEANGFSETQYTACKVTMQHFMKVYSEPRP